MKRRVGTLLVVCLVAVAIAARAEGERTPTPEKVSIAFGVGTLIPTGRFNDAADAGFSYSFTGYYDVNEYLAPAFVFQQGFLESDPSSGVSGGSVDTYSLAGGVRVFLLPKRYWLRPWATLLGGYHRYAQHRRHMLTPVFAVGHTSRDDPFFLSTGGGVELRLHPNFGLGVDTRFNFSFSDSDNRGERDLTAVSIAGVAILHY